MSAKARFAALIAPLIRSRADFGGFTFRVYQRAVKRRERLSDGYLAALDQALEWAEKGRIEAKSPASSAIVPTDPLAETRIGKR
jgi:hypothetical protein